MSDFPRINSTAFPHLAIARWGQVDEPGASILVGEAARSFMEEHKEVADIYKLMEIPPGMDTSEGAEPAMTIWMHTPSNHLIGIGKVFVNLRGVDEYAFIMLVPDVEAEDKDRRIKEIGMKAFRNAVPEMHARNN